VLIRKIIKYICALLFVVGFAIIFGTAGASDLNNISMNQIVTQVLIGLVLFVGGFVGYQLVKEWEWRNES
jgi:hypothetical protein